MESEKLTGWQPIETAPKDGTRVLLWLGAPWSEVEAAQWYAPWDSWLTDRICPNETDEVGGIGSRVPTHWQPLPAPPGTTRAPADLRSALEAETIERCAKVADVYAEPDDLPSEFSKAFELAARRIARRIRNLAPTKGDVS